LLLALEAGSLKLHVHVLQRRDGLAADADRLMKARALISMFPMQKALNQNPRPEVRRLKKKKKQN